MKTKNKLFNLMFSKQANELQGLPMNIFFYTSMGVFQNYDLFKSQLRANFHGIILLLIMIFYVRNKETLLPNAKTKYYDIQWKH